MRQAGRYMSAFRKYSDHYPFRYRSETPSIAVELSLQPYYAFQTDAVIMFSDILTPLPALGVEFDMQPGKGPVIANPIRTPQALIRMQREFQPQTDLPFVGEVLERLRDELKNTECGLIGFVGAPFTLAAYVVEGGAAKNLTATKGLMYGKGKDVFQGVLERLADAIGEYAIFQVNAGAQVIQFFDSWAHHLTPKQYERWALPYARKAIQKVRKECPGVPIVFFANGAGGKLETLKKELGDVVEVFGVDWSVDMKDARNRFGHDVVLQGNVDPCVLTVGEEEEIRQEVRDCVNAAQGNLIVNLGHGVIKETPEEAVRVFCDEVRSITWE